MLIIKRGYIMTNMSNIAEGFMNIYMEGMMLDEKIKQIPKHVEAAKEINKGQMEIIKDLIQSTKELDIKDVVLALLAKQTLGAGDIAGLSKILGM